MTRSKNNIDILFTQHVEFIAGAGTPESLPHEELPEIAVWGRSNVGKSSLLNALTARKKLARISKTPGRTQQINFFSIGDQFVLADLPGYGFAKAAKHKIAAWEELIYAYFSTREALQTVLILIDARHGLKEADVEALDRLDDLSVPYHVVLTKADECKPADLEQTRTTVEKSLALRRATHTSVITTSSEKLMGISELRKMIVDVAL